MSLARLLTTHHPPVDFSAYEQNKIYFLNLSVHPPRPPLFRRIRLDILVENNFDAVFQKVFRYRKYTGLMVR